MDHQFGEHLLHQFGRALPLSLLRGAQIPGKRYVGDGNPESPFKEAIEAVVAFVTRAHVMSV